MGGVTHSCGLGPQDLGPYVLGHGGSDEERIRAVLAGCPSCTREVARLRQVVAALAVVPSAPAPPLPPSSFARVLEGLPEPQRPPARRLGLVLAAAAAVLAVLAGLAGFALGSGRAGPEGEVLRLTGSSGATARVVLEERDWGTALSLQVDGLDPGTVYGTWLARPDGERVSAGTFRPDDDGAATLRLSAALPRARTQQVGVTALGGDDVLVATRPAG